MLTKQMNNKIKCRIEEKVNDILIEMTNGFGFAHTQEEMKIYDNRNTTSNKTNKH